MEKTQLLLTVGQAANALGLGTNQVYAMIQKGQLSAHVVERRKRITLADLESIEPNVVHTLLIGTRQAANILGVIPQTVRELGDLGVLTAVQGGGAGTHRRYRYGDVIEAAATRHYRKNGKGVAQ